MDTGFGLAMRPRIQPIAIKTQQLIVIDSNVTIGCMTDDSEKAAFALRLNEICDDMDVPPKGRGRQTVLKTVVDLSQNAVLKWLEGEGYPSLENARRLAVWANVHIEWLLSGRGPKRIGEYPISGIENGQQSASTHAASPDEHFVASYNSADAATRALIDIALAAPSAPLPDGLSPSLRILVDMARTAIRAEQEKK
jgi:transcriptional regulator with XRE-family HTH domain